MAKNVWERSSEFLHPYVRFLVDSIATIRDYIRDRAWTRAARYLYWFISYLDPHIKEKLKDDRAKLRAILDGSLRYTEDVFQEILDNVMDELHKEGYFAGAKHKIIYVGGQKKALEEIEIPEL